MAKLETYVYKDNNQGKWEKGQWITPVIFSCKAESITEADSLFQKETGQSIEKQPHIGCSVKQQGIFPLIFIQAVVYLRQKGKRIMARMTKADKAIEKAVEAAYGRHFEGVQVNMMDLSKIMNIGRDALLNGKDLDAAMSAAVAQFRQN